MNKNKHTAKKTTRTKATAAGVEAGEENQFEKNLNVLRKRRRRIKSNMEKLDALIDGTAKEVDLDDIIEARKLLGFYNVRLLKAVKKNKAKLEEA